MKARGRRPPRRHSPSLSPAAVLQRLPELRLHLAPDGSLGVLTGARTLAFGSHALAVLDAFSNPTALEDGLAGLRVAGVHDWVELVATVRRLHAAGVLVDPAADAAPRGGAGGFDAASLHRGLLDDRARTEGFLKGIRATVRPGDVVVDLGSGTGVLALAAARAGAARVYAVEAGVVAGAARRLFAANGVQDRVVLVEGWSSRVTLPERADVLVSEIVGSDPFGESVLEFFSDARRRFLKPGARVVPRRLRVFGTPVTAHQVDRATFSLQAAGRWRRWYGFDFGPLAQVVARSPTMSYVKPTHARTWPTLAEPVLLLDVDLARPEQAPWRVRRRVESARNGILTGLLVHFELDTGGATITTEPARARRDTSWLNPVWLTGEPFAVRRGDALAITYQRGPGVGRAACRPA